MISLRRSAAFWIVIGVVLAAAVWMWSGYNGLITARESVNASWAQVETQYQRRADLVPNLVRTVQGAADFEQETLTNVTEARTRWLNAESRPDRIAAAGQFDSALSRLLVTVESYPQLQATQAFRDLMTQLEGTENRIATARRDYNEEVRRYNVRVRQFPGNILASAFGFDPQEMFASAPGSENAPTVNFE